jgi:hypothetical protein
MEHIVLTISSELFDDVSHQEASVRKNLTIRTLLAEIQREFGLPDGNYTLTLASSGQTLDLDKTLEQFGIRTGAELVFGRERRRLSQQMIAKGGHFFQAISSSTMAVVREESSGTIFELRWQPALIGRPDASNQASAEILAINLGAFDESRSVSRQHARITEHNGLYYLEGLVEKNPTYLNEQKLAAGERRNLKNGDKIRAGKITMTFSLKS